MLAEDGRDRLVEVGRSGTRDGQLADLVQGFGDHPPGVAHEADFAGALQLDHSRLAAAQHPTFLARVGLVSIALALAHKTAIVPHDQVAVDLLHQVEANADDDEEAGAAEERCDRVVDSQGVLDD